MTDNASILSGGELLALVDTLGDALRARQWRLATAESCTGGLLAGTCTAPAGASDWFDAGFVTYANGAKTGVLGVPDALIARHGAVSAEVADAMARGALAHAKVQLALSVTGIAGPGGGRPEKPVGTVAIAVSTPDEARVRTFQFFGGRDLVKFQSTQAALNMLRLMLS